MSGYLAACDGDRSLALELYVWNAQISGAYAEALGYVEIALRNVLADRLAARHRSRRHLGSWLDDPDRVLDLRARDEIAKARQRVRAKRKPLSDGQVITELSFGFWRFLLARRYRSSLWPDLAGGFGHAPNRSQATVEAPVSRLHVFRNRLAHHEPVWDRPLTDLLGDVRIVLGYIDPGVRDWALRHCRIESTLRRRPAAPRRR